MTFEYIAGFFDGEGHIEKPNKRDKKWNKVNHLSIGQVRGEVLFRIKDFLKTNNINSNIYFTKKSLKNPRWSDFYTLHITDRASVVRFLRKVRPFLIVKLREAEAALRFIKTAEWNYIKPSVSRLEKARNAYSSGLSFRQVEKITGLDSHTIRNYMFNIYGERGRPKQQAIKMRLRERELTI
jgi:intein/homing endonuclease